MSYDITVPIAPDSNLSPNAHVHWRIKAKAASHLKEAGRLGSKMGQGKRPASASPLNVHVVIYWGKSRRRMDYDNAISVCKHMLDGICEDLGVDDKHFQSVTVEQKRDPEGLGFCLVTITECAA